MCESQRRQGGLEEQDHRNIKGFCAEGTEYGVIRTMGIESDFNVYGRAEQGERGEGRGGIGEEELRDCRWTTRWKMEEMNYGVWGESSYIYAAAVGENGTEVRSTPYGRKEL
jgi:hypothetical protein